MERPEENAREKPEEDEIGLDVVQKFDAQTRTEVACVTPAPTNNYCLMVTVLTTTFASVNTHGITKSFWQRTQTTQHTCYNISMWDYLHRSRKRVEVHK